MITFWELKGHTFKAKGTAQNMYNVLKVKQSKCLVQRISDGFQHWIDTQLVINLVNESNN